MTEKWEYRIEQMMKVLHWDMKKLNELGDQGWEAVGPFYDAKYSVTYVLLKRRKE